MVYSTSKMRLGRPAKSQLVAELGPVQPQLVTSFMDRIVLKMFEKLSIFLKSTLCVVTCIKCKESEDKVSLYVHLILLCVQSKTESSVAKAKNYIWGGTS